MKRGVFFLLATSAAACSSTSTNGSADSAQVGAPSPDGDGGPGGGGAGGPGGPDGASVAPLDPSTFLFHKRVREGAVHVYAFDTRSGSASLVSKLGDDGKTGVVPSNLAISPDRRWAAFTAFMAPTDADLKTGLLTPMVWAGSTDGKILKRLSDPIPDPNTTPCNYDGDCSSLGIGCELSVHRCRPWQFSISVSSPAFTPDGQTVYFDFGQYWFEGNEMQGGSRPASVPFRGGPVQTYPQGSTCAQVTNVAFKPSGGALAAVHSVCAAGSPGLYTWDVPPAHAALLVQGSFGGIDVDLSTPAWLPDGSALFFLASTTFSNGTSQITGKGILAVDAATKKLSVVLGPQANKALVYQDFALAPDGQRLVVCVANGQAADLFVLQRGSQDLKQLTQDGVSCHPAW